MVGVEHREECVFKKLSPKTDGYIDSNFTFELSKKSCTLCRKKPKSKQLVVLFNRQPYCKKCAGRLTSEANSTQKIVPPFILALPMRFFEVADSVYRTINIELFKNGLMNNSTVSDKIGAILQGHIAPVVHTNLDQLIVTVSAEEIIYTGKEKEALVLYIYTRLTHLRKQINTVKRKPAGVYMSDALGNITKESYIEDIYCPYTRKRLDIKNIRKEGSSEKAVYTSPLCYGREIILDIETLTYSY